MGFEKLPGFGDFLVLSRVASLHILKGVLGFSHNLAGRGVSLEFHLLAAAKIILDIGDFLGTLLGALLGAFISIFAGVLVVRNAFVIIRFLGDLLVFRRFDFCNWFSSLRGG